MVHVLMGDDDPLEVLGAAAVPRSASSSASSDVAEFGPESTSVSGSSSTSQQFTRPTANGVGTGSVDHARMSARTSSRRRSMSSSDTSDSRHRRSSGSVLEGRTLKCQSS